jgi:hypothetical protein
MRFLLTKEMTETLLGKSEASNLKTGSRIRVRGCDVYYSLRRYRMLADSRDAVDLMRDAGLSSEFVRLNDRYIIRETDALGVVPV